jgi:hypothetical protein
MTCKTNLIILGFGKEKRCKFRLKGTKFYGKIGQIFAIREKSNRRKALKTGGFKIEWKATSRNL